MARPLECLSKPGHGECGEGGERRRWLMAKPLVSDALWAEVEPLLPEMGCGSGMTCWRRLRDWQQADVWPRLHRKLLDHLGVADRIDWTRAALDSRLVPAKRGGPAPVPIRPIAAVRAAKTTS